MIDEPKTNLHLFYTCILKRSIQRSHLYDVGLHVVIWQKEPIGDYHCPVNVRIAS